MELKTFLDRERESRRFSERLRTIAERREFRRKTQANRGGAIRDTCTTFIYGLFHLGNLFYIGQTNNPSRRAKSYERLKSHGNFYLGLRLMRLYYANASIQMRILETVRDPNCFRKRANRRERARIEQAAREGVVLCNKMNNPRTKNRGLDYGALNTDYPRAERPGLSIRIA